MQNRKFFPGAWYHIYSIAKDGGVLFYRTTDRLCFYTVLSILARRYRINILGLAIMFTHFHLMVKSIDLPQLRLFMQQVLSTFSRLMNEDRNLDGARFKRPFGSAPKRTPKEQRSSLIYLFNNPVEKKLCSTAIDDRWTFLAYARQEYPFSNKLVKRQVRHTLRNACDTVDFEHRAGRYLRPSLLQRLFEPLTQTEQEQLADYIIHKYACIDYQTAIALFGSFDKLLIATEASAGKEFDVGEEYDPSSDAPYREMCDMAARNGLFRDWKLLHLTPGERAKWARNFRIATGASEKQVRKFLHDTPPLPPKSSLQSPGLQQQR